MYMYEKLLRKWWCFTTSVSLEHLPHLLLFSVLQQPEYETELNRKEREKLKSKVSRLSEEDKNYIYQKGKSHNFVAVRI